MARRDQVITPRVLLDAVKMKEIVRGLFLMAIIASRFVRIIKWDMIGSSPLEQKLPGLNINFLKYRVVDPASTLESQFRAVELNIFVNCDQSRSIICDFEFM
jgi:hypothetical protein